MTDSYREVTTRFRAVSDKAVLVDQSPARGHGTVWIPRSLIHGVDDDRLQYRERGEEFVFRLMEWKAEELGFA